MTWKRIPSFDGEQQGHCQMTKEERASFKQQIIELIEETKADIEQTESMTEPVKPENSIGRISRMDAINNKSVMEASLRQKKRKLSKLQIALKKVDDEAFGHCRRCKKAINPKRLMLLPESDMCVSCASR